MAPARKSARQSKTPAKLQDFVHAAEREKDGAPHKAGSTSSSKPTKRKPVEKTPVRESKDIDDASVRRSRRTPKISEKLKSYLHEKGDTPDKPDSSGKKTPRKLSEAFDADDDKSTTSKRVKVAVKGATPAKTIHSEARSSRSPTKATRKTKATTPSAEVADDSYGDLKALNKDLMTKLLNFGAEIVVSMASNNDKFLEITSKESRRIQPLPSIDEDRDEDLDEGEAERLLEWIEREEQQRREYRQKILDSMRTSHRSNMALFTQLLDMLRALHDSLKE